MLEINAGNSISSITKLLATHFSDEKKEIWFRGHSDYKWKLEPTIFREKYNEAGMYEEFIRRFPEHSNNHKNVFEWLTLMQHYGLPTRLLDWTTNLLVALFFVVLMKKIKIRMELFLLLNSYNPIIYLPILNMPPTNTMLQNY